MSYTILKQLRKIVKHAAELFPNFGTHPSLNTSATVVIYELVDILDSGKPDDEIDVVELYEALKPLNSEIESSIYELEHKTYRNCSIERAAEQRAIGNLLKARVNTLLMMLKDQPDKKQQKDPWGEMI